MRRWGRWSRLPVVQFAAGGVATILLRWMWDQSLCYDSVVVDLVPLDIGCGFCYMNMVYLELVKIATWSIIVILRFGFYDNIFHFSHMHWSREEKKKAVEESSPLFLRMCVCVFVSELTWFNFRRRSSFYCRELFFLCLFRPSLLSFYLILVYVYMTLFLTAVNEDGLAWTEEEHHQYTTHSFSFAILCLSFELS